MIRNFFCRSLVIPAAVLALALSSPAQQASQNSTNSAASKRKTATPKPKTKVWTDDNIGSVRTPADNYEEKQETKAELKDASDKQAVAGGQSAASTQPKDHPPLLSNPKTVGSADNMIAWEDRDIAAQTEFIGKLQQELDAAPAQDKPRIQNLLDQKKQLLEQTKAERQGLVDQKKSLQQKAASPNGAN